MNTITNLSSKQLRIAAGLKEKIQSLEKEFNQLLGSPAKPVASPAPKKKFKMSAAAKARISAAAKARWAKVKGTKAIKTAPKASPVPKKKGKISPEGIARIKAAQKARWAKIKAGKKPVPSK